MHTDTHFTSLDSWFLAVLPVFSSHLSLLTSCNLLALILLSLLSLSVWLRVATIWNFLQSVHVLGDVHA